MSTDIDNIKRTVNAYIDGVTNRVHSRFLESWNPDSRMSFLRNGELVIVPRSFWEEWCRKPSEDTVLSSEIKSIDMTGNVAMAKVEVVRESVDAIRTLTDYLTLLRISSDKWEIINKSFHADVVSK